MSACCSFYVILSSLVGPVFAEQNTSIIDPIRLLLTRAKQGAAQRAKKQFFTQTWFEPKIFYPKKCVKYDKSNSHQNSVKGPKDPNSAKKCQKSNIKF